MEIYAVGHSPQVQEIAHQRGRKEIQQEKQYAAADGEGKAEKVLPVGGIQSADRGLVAQEGVHRHIPGSGQGPPQDDVRVNVSAFPAGDRFVGYAQQVGKFLLGIIFGLAVALEAFGKFHLAHRRAPPFEGIIGGSLGDRPVSMVKV